MHPDPIKDSEATACGENNISYVELTVAYGGLAVVVHPAFIGPSGCGKSTYLRLFNRMNDYISSFRRKEMFSLMKKTFMLCPYV